MSAVTASESQCENLDNSLGVDVQITQKSFRGHARSQCKRSTSDMVPGDFCTPKEALEMVSMEYNYAVVRKPKKNSTPLSAGMSEAPGQCLPAVVDKTKGKKQRDEVICYYIICALTAF